MRCLSKAARERDKAKTARALAKLEVLAIESKALPPWKPQPPKLLGLIYAWLELEGD